MTGWRRSALVGAAVLCALAAVGLTVVAVVVDLSVADQLASVVGAIVGLVGLALSIWALCRSGPANTVEAGPGAVAAGGNINRVVSGSNNRIAASRASSVAPISEQVNQDVRAMGTGSVAAGESIGEVIIGDGNEA